MNKILLQSNPVESLVACVSTLHLKAYDHKKIQFEFPMVWPLDEFMGSHNFMVKTLGPRVKKVALSYLEKSTKHIFNMFITESIHLA